MESKLTEAHKLTTITKNKTKNKTTYQRYIEAIKLGNYMLLNFYMKLTFAIGTDIFTFS